MAKAKHHNTPPAPRPKAPEAAPPSVDPRITPIDWRNTHIWGYQPVRDLMVIAAVVGLFYLGYVARVVTVPLLVALLLAYLFEPLVRWMTSAKWVSRPGAVSAIIVCAGLLVVVPMTVGIGFAVVQGTRMAGAAAQVASDLLVVTGFVEKALEDGPGWLEVVDKAPRVRQRFEFKDVGEPPPPAVHSAPSEPPATPENSGAPSDGEQPASGASSSDPQKSPAQRADKQLSSGLPAPDPAAATKAYNNLGSPWTTVANVYIEQRLQDRAGGESSGTVLAMRKGLEWVKEQGDVIGRQALGTGAQAVGVALTTAKRFGMLVFGGFLTAFFFYFLSTGYGKVLRFWEGLIPDRRKGRAIELLVQMDRVVSGFVRGRLTIALILAVVYTIGYWLVGVPAPLIMGPLVGLVTLVPYVALIGMPVCSLLMALEPSSVEWQTQWWWVLLAPALVYGLGQALDDYVLSPIIQGKNTGMDTPTILFASIAGGALAGVYGLLLAIPIAACIRVLMKEVFWPRFRAWAEGRAEDVLPIGKE